MWFVFVYAGDNENVDKFSRRLVKVTKEHNNECKQLLQLMGIPFVEVSGQISSLGAICVAWMDYKVVFTWLFLKRVQTTLCWFKESPSRQQEDEVEKEEKGNKTKNIFK